MNVISINQLEISLTESKISTKVNYLNNNNQQAWIWLLFDFNEDIVNQDELVALLYERHTSSEDLVCTTFQDATCSGDQSRRWLLNYTYADTDIIPETTLTTEELAIEQAFLQSVKDYVEANY